MYEDIKKAVNDAKEMILEAEKHIWQNPETGYKEWKTSKYMAEKFKDFGYELHMAEDIPGFYADYDTGKHGPTVLVLGELDSLICEDHPDADSKTGAVHSCGHHAQCAALLGVAKALKDSDIAKDWCGKIRLCAVPAEEPIELEYRQSLIHEGTIKYICGKPEFISRGYFDDVDMAFMFHTTTSHDCNFVVQNGSTGALTKNMYFTGKSAHAGGSPYAGINALYAANLSLNAINALRETFKEPDLVRVHPIITKGGDAVNAIPADVRMESFVRALTYDSMKTENKKVNRALGGSAVAMGAQVGICDALAASPLINDKTLRELFVEAVKDFDPDVKYADSSHISTGCTDMGDLSMIMPALHPYVAGAIGTSHGNDYRIGNPENACVDSAKVQLILLAKLLSDEGKAAKRVLENKGSHIISKEKYLEIMDEFNKADYAVSYENDNKATIEF